MKREQVQRSKSKRVEEQPETKPVKGLDTDDLLAEIDEALQGVDEQLATNYIQQGGE